MNEKLQVPVDHVIETMRWFCVDCLDNAPHPSLTDYIATLMQEPGWAKVLVGRWDAARKAVGSGRLTLRELAELQNEPLGGDPDSIRIYAAQADFALPMVEAFAQRSAAASEDEMLVTDATIAVICAGSLCRSMSEEPISRDALATLLRADQAANAVHAWLTEVLILAFALIVNRRPPWLDVEAWDAMSALSRRLRDDIALEEDGQEGSSDHG